MLILCKQVLLFWTQHQTREMPKTEKNSNISLPSIQKFPKIHCVRVGRREKTQICRISFLFCVLQHRNYTSVKILITFTWLQTKKIECNNRTFNSKPYFQGWVLGSNKEFSDPWQSQKEKRQHSKFFKKKLALFNFKGCVLYSISEW